MIKIIKPLHFSLNANRSHVRIVQLDSFYLIIRSICRKFGFASEFINVRTPNVRIANNFSLLRSNSRMEIPFFCPRTAENFKLTFFVFFSFFFEKKFLLHTRRFQIFKRCVFTFPICLFTLSVYLKKFLPIVARWYGMEMLNFSYQYRINPLIEMEIRGLCLVCRVVRTGSLKNSAVHTLPSVKPPTSSLVSTIIKSCTGRTPFFLGREESASRENEPRFRWVPGVTRQRERVTTMSSRRAKVTTRPRFALDLTNDSAATFHSGVSSTAIFATLIVFPGDEMNFHLFFISYRLVFQFRGARAT